MDTATREKRTSSRLRVLQLLADGQWHTNVEITLPKHGGNRGVGRLWEAERDFGLTIERARYGVDMHRYRWVDPWPREQIVDRMARRIVEPKQGVLI